MNPGESKTETIPADKAYGPHRPEMVIEVERQKLPGDLQPQVGQRLQLKHPSGKPVPVRITEVADSSVPSSINASRI